MDNSPFDLALVGMSERLRAYFQRRICDPAIVDDLIQESFLKAFRSREMLRDQARLEAWVYRIAYHTVSDFYRRRSTVTKLADVESKPEASSGTDVRAVVAASALCYLGTIPESYRIPVHLAEYEGLSHQEVARKLGLTLSATKSRVRRGKIMVRNLMEARCRFEYDTLGNIIGYQVRCVPCAMPSGK